MIIRRFRPTDLSKVYEIECKSFKDPYSTSFLLSLFQQYPDTFLVAEENNRIVGYVISRIVSHKGHVLAIAVEPSERRRGIGRALMEVITKKFANHDVEEIWLEVRASNLGAIEFYERLGFHQKGFVPRYYFDGEDAIILKKALR